uniref:Major facilitator superfamily (MFS) profile domain-containing protein n=1 Tax=Vitrella brassicaformis TaxID=1169539 RepID=A0A7S1P3B0_9ALVE
MQHLSWRLLLVCATLPAIVAIGPAIVYLPESPHFLLVKGRGEEARQVLRSLARTNGRTIKELEEENAISMPEQAAAAAASEEGAGMSTIGILLGRKYLFSTIVLCYSSCCFNLTIYGLLYALPQCFPAMEQTSHIPPGYALLIGEVFFSLNCVPLLYADVLPRVVSISSLLLLEATILLSFSGALVTGLTTLATVIIMTAKLVGQTAFSFVYFFASELYPTVVRASGVSLAVAMGRLGGIFSPMLFEGLTMAMAPPSSPSTPAPSLWASSCWWPCACSPTRCSSPACPSRRAGRPCWTCTPMSAKTRATPRHRCSGPYRTDITEISRRRTMTAPAPHESSPCRLPWRRG